MMEQEKQFDNFLNRAEDYGKTKYDLLRLKAVDKSSEVVSSLVLRMIALFMFCVFFLVFNIGLGLWLAKFFDKAYLGFFALAIFYGVLTMVIYFIFGKSIKQRIQNSIIKQLLK